MNLTVILRNRLILSSMCLCFYLCFTRNNRNRFSHIFTLFLSEHVVHEKDCIFTRNALKKWHDWYWTIKQFNLRSICVRIERFYGDNGSVSELDARERKESTWRVKEDRQPRQGMTATGSWNGVARQTKRPFPLGEIRACSGVCRPGIGQLRGWIAHRGTFDLTEVD